MIYFIQAVDGGPVKIGTTIDLERRHKQLENSYGRPLAVLATMDGDRDQELELHERFAHLRIGKTEQFRPAPELADFIGKPLIAAAGNVVEMENKRKPLVLMASTEYRAWFDDFKRHINQLDNADVIRMGLKLLAKQTGFREPPKR